MPRIALLTMAVTGGDAVSNDVIGMHDVLRQRGYDVRVYAAHWDREEPQVWPAQEIEYFLEDAHDVLIYHYSLGWDFGAELLSCRKWRTIAKYHNVTPPEFFVRHSEEYTELCRKGRRSIQTMVNAGCDLYLSDSEYNMRELLALGAAPARCAVVPPFHHADRLFQLEPDLALLDQYSDEKTNLLTVGRIFPNKGHAALIDAFAIYHHDYNPRSRLLIVGKESEQLRAYSERLRRRAAARAVSGAVVFAGPATDAELGAYYRVADAFALASEHEGFGVPLVEAMAMQVPVVAYGAAAVPETVGGAGLVWPERDPRLLAASLDAVVRDPRVAAGLGRMGRRRYGERFANRRIEAQFLAALLHLL